MEKSNKTKSWMQALGRQLLAGVALLVGAGMMSGAPVKVTGNVGAGRRTADRGIRVCSGHHHRCLDRH